MPAHFVHTPEALLGRNDSKNPASTCKGITSSGRPCRRAIAISKASTTSNGRSSGPLLGGVITAIDHRGRVQEAELYCWQHKGQVLAGPNDGIGHPRNDNRNRASNDLYPLKERGSIDTLIQRLGIDGRDEKVEPHRSRENQRNTKQYSDRSHEASSSDRVVSRTQQGEISPEKRRPKTKKQTSFWQSLCCITETDDDYLKIVRHRRRVDGHKIPRAENSTSSDSTCRPTHLNSSMPIRPKASDHNPTSRVTVSHRRREDPETNHVLSLLPPHLSPAITSALFAELVKPISSFDEDGYIYIFWLTSDTKQAPARSAAQSLLGPPTARPQHTRRVSDVMTEYSFDGSAPETKGKEVVLLKIGRANNITRRMNEWQRQCGYELNLVRWYPYVPSSATPSPQPSPNHKHAHLYPDLRPSLQGRRQSDVVRKVPFVKRVERLIHLELAEKQVKHQCDACGREHREWFEVPASQAGVRAVDECVRRWVEWAERTASA